MQQAPSMQIAAVIFVSATNPYNITDIHTQQNAEDKLSMRALTNVSLAIGVSNADAIASRILGCARTHSPRNLPLCRAARCRDAQPLSRAGL